MAITSGEAEACFEVIEGWPFFCRNTQALPIERGATSTDLNASSTGPTLEDITGQEYEAD